MTVTNSAYKILQVIPLSTPKSLLIRIEATDLKITLREIFLSLSNLCWVNNLPNTSNMFKKSLQRRAETTVKRLEEVLISGSKSNVSSSAGEYVVSELAHSVVVNEFGYIDIPLAELFKQKSKGNPGFDFFAEDPKSNIVLFGEAKYSSTSNSYQRAFVQIVEFVEKDGKDVLDMADLEHFCSQKAQENMLNGKKGFIAAFSSTTISDEDLKKHIENNNDYKQLLDYEELVCVAVNIPRYEQPN